MALSNLVSAVRHLSAALAAFGVESPAVIVLQDREIRTLEAEFSALVQHRVPGNEDGKFRICGVEFRGLTL